MWSLLCVAPQGHSGDSTFYSGGGGGAGLGVSLN